MSFTMMNEVLNSQDHNLQTLFITVILVFHIHCVLFCSLAILYYNYILLYAYAYAHTHCYTYSVKCRWKGVYSIQPFINKNVLTFDINLCHLLRIDTPI